MESPSRKPYTFGFTAGGLGLSYCQTLARLFLDLGDWKRVKTEVLQSNAFQQERKTSSQRVEREFRPRVELLSPGQLEILAEGSRDTARPMALLAAFKRYPLIFDFCVLKLAPKLQVFDTELRPSDLENFFDEVEVGHPEVEELTDSTLAKIRQVMIRILAEGGILTDTHDPVIAPKPVTAEVVRVIADESPLLLRGFLMNEAEISTYS